MTISINSQNVVTVRLIDSNVQRFTFRDNQLANAFINGLMFGHSIAMDEMTSVVISKKSELAPKGFSFESE